MMKRQLWVDHKFKLGIDIGWTRNILSRLQDTTLRLVHYCSSLNDDQLSKKLNGAWSIKEQIGHLSDLEDLWISRILDYSKKNDVLSKADMSNQKTNDANHNSKLLEDLLDNFKGKREKMFRTFESLDFKSQNHQAMHPRIKLPMKPIDLLFFIAEHDDHHIVSIKQLVKNL